MHIQTNIGKAIKNSKHNSIGSNSMVAVHQPSKVYEKSLPFIRDYGKQFLANGKVVTKLVEKFREIGFGSLWLVSPRPKGKGKDAVPSLNTFITIEQFDGFKAELVKTFNVDVQRALARLAKDRTAKQADLVLAWKGKANQILNDCSRNLAIQEDKERIAKIEAEEQAKVKADPSYVPKTASKKPSRNKTPKEVYIGNINQCISLVQEHESTLNIAQPADLVTLLRKAISLLDNKAN